MLIIASVRPDGSGILIGLRARSEMRKMAESLGYFLICPNGQKMGFIPATRFGVGFSEVSLISSLIQSTRNSTRGRLDVLVPSPANVVPHNRPLFWLANRQPEHVTPERIHCQRQRAALFRKDRERVMLGKSAEFARTVADSSIAP